MELNVIQIHVGHFQTLLFFPLLFGAKDLQACRNQRPFGEAPLGNLPLVGKCGLVDPHLTTTTTMMTTRKTKKTTKKKKTKRYGEL